MKTLSKDQPKNVGSRGEKVSSVPASAEVTLERRQALALPRSEGQYTLNNMFYENQIGCVLVYEQENGRNCSVGTCFRTLNDNEKQLTKTQRKGNVWQLYGP